MRAPFRVAGDVLLGAFAVVVIAGAGATLTTAPQAVSASAPDSSGVPASTPSAESRTTASPTANAANDAKATDIVLAGPDLSRMTVRMVDRTVYAVTSLNNLPATSFAEVEPSVVVLQILAGSRTTVRTADAITAARARWPGVLVVVVGPMRSAEQLSTASVKAATLAAHATFLDPVQLKWRAPDATQTMTDKEVSAMSDHLTVALAAVLA